jgi:hypothetical protein
MIELFAAGHGPVCPAFALNDCGSHPVDGLAIGEIAIAVEPTAAAGDVQGEETLVTRAAMNSRMAKRSPR